MFLISFNLVCPPSMVFSSASSWLTSNGRQTTKKNTLGFVPSFFRKYHGQITNSTFQPHKTKKNFTTSTRRAPLSSTRSSTSATRDRSTTINIYVYIDIHTLYYYMLGNKEVNLFSTEKYWDSDNKTMA